MKLFKLCIIILVISAVNIYSQQRIGFIASDVIREKFPEAQLAEQRLQSNVEEWKRQIEQYQIKIHNLELKIKRNRLIWTDSERMQREEELKNLKTKKTTYAQEQFEPGGEYDKMVKTIWEPIELKIFAAVRSIAAENSYDFVIDKSLQPVPYTNYKYDLTVKVLKRLGVDTAQLEAELKKKIEADPRNKVKESKQRQSKRRRSRRVRSASEKEEMEQKEEINPVGNEEEIIPPGQIEKKVSETRKRK
jgi:outer membrane protein